MVSDKSGKPVAGLQENDFTLLDNKQPAKILSFRGVEGAATDPPVQVILLLDEVNTTYSNVAIARQQIEKFLQQNGGELARPLSLAFLSDSGTVVSVASSRDGNALAAELNKEKNGLRTITRSQGFYGAADRQQLSVRGLQQLAAEEAAKPGRKLVVWISPGWPLLSGPEVQLSRKNQEALFRTIVSLSDSLRWAGITLYSVDPLGTSDAGGLQTIGYEQYVKGVKKVSQAQIGNLALQVFAVQTGGRVQNSNNDIASEIAKCMADAAAFYELSFDAAVGDGPDEYHALEVKIDKPGLMAHTRTGYYAQPTPRP